MKRCRNCQITKPRNMILAMARVQENRATPQTAKIKVLSWPGSFRKNDTGSAAVCPVKKEGAHMQLFTSSFLTFTVLTWVAPPCEVAELQSHLTNLWKPPLLNRGPRCQDIKGKIIHSRSPKNILTCLYWAVFSHRSLPLSFDWIKSSEEKKRYLWIPMCREPS